MPERHSEMSLDLVIVSFCAETLVLAASALAWTAASSIDRRLTRNSLW